MQFLMILAKKMLRIKFIRSQKAATSIEFALLFLPFFIMIAVIIESSLLTYQISMVDHTVSKAAKYASTFKGKVKEKFDEFLEKDENKFLTFMTDEAGMESSVSYCKNLEEVKEDNCNDDEENSVIAIYNIRYKINPLFPVSRMIVEDEFVQSKAIFFIEGSKVEVKKEDDKKPNK